MTTTTTTSTGSVVEGLLFCEFDTQAGPKISFQTPEGCVAPETWDGVFEYVIAKPQLSGRVVSIADGGGRRIVGVLVSISDAKYSRNALCFNCALVLAPAASDAVSLRAEPSLKAVAASLSDLEKAQGFLTSAASREELFSATLPSLLAAFRRPHTAPPSSVRFADGCSLSIAGAEDDKAALRSAPATTDGDDEYEAEEFAGTLLWRRPGAAVSAVGELAAADAAAAALYERIDGTCSVRAARGNRATVAALLARNLVVRADPFAQSYVVTPRVREAVADAALRSRLLSTCFGARSKLDDALGLLGLLRPGTTAQQLINAHAFKDHRVDDPRRFLTFCLAHGWLAPVPEPHAVEEYACLTEAPNPSSLSHSALRDPRAPLRHFV